MRFSCKKIVRAFPDWNLIDLSMPFHGTWVWNEYKWFFRPLKKTKKRVPKNVIFVHGFKNDLKTMIFLEGLKMVM
jgi:hypothetical protein